MGLRSLLQRGQRNDDFRTFANSGVSLLITMAFAGYNGFLGIAYGSPWHGSIGVYYCLLAVLRSVILLAERKGRTEDKLRADGRRRRAFMLCSILLLVLNLSLIGPLSLLVRQEKDVNLTLIPAIAMAVYAFYKITLAAVHMAQRRRSRNCLVRLLRSVRFIDALVSIMTLQNTLIMVSNTGDKQTLLPLTAITSGLMWLAAAALSVSSLVWGVKENRGAVRG